MANQFSRRSDRAKPTKAHDVLQARSTQTKKLTILMDPALHKRLQMQAVTEDRTMTDIITTLVEGYLDSGNAGPNPAV